MATFTIEEIENLKKVAAKEKQDDEIKNIQTAANDQISVKYAEIKAIEIQRDKDIAAIRNA